MSVDDLPRSIQPDRDLWSGIESRLDATHTQPRLHGAPLLAAAAALMLGLAGWWSAPEAAPVVAPAEVQQVPAWEEDMRASASALEAELDARRHELDPASVAVIEENLALIDAAIAECRDALDSSEQADQALMAAYAMKIAALEAVL
jgi:hypothetical protein